MSARGAVTGRPQCQGHLAEASHKLWTLTCGQARQEVGRAVTWPRCALETPRGAGGRCGWEGRGQHRRPQGSSARGAERGSKSSDFSIWYFSAILGLIPSSLDSCQFSGSCCQNSGRKLLWVLRVLPCAPPTPQTPFPGLAGHLPHPLHAPGPSHTGPSSKPTSWTEAPGPM